MPISPLHLRTLVDTLALDGHPHRRAVELAGLTDADMEPLGPWVDESCLDRLMIAAMSVTGDPAYGFTASTSLAQTRYGPHALLIVQAPSLRHALHDIREFAPLLVETPELDVIEQGGESLMVARPLGRTAEGLRFRTEWLMSLCVQLSRRAGGRSEDVLEATFPYEQPAHVERYRTVFGPNLRFKADRASLRFPTLLLDANLPGHDRVVYDTLRLQAETQLALRFQRMDIVHSVRQAVFNALPQVPDASHLASMLGQSERSLRRQLSKRGLSYAEMVQRCQREVAERLLAEGRVPIKQIADEIGFSSPSCFHRAFRRWHGVTPNEWRSRGP
jgi:AraC-like DNA-binding protein